MYLSKSINSFGLSMDFQCLRGDMRGIFGSLVLRWNMYRLGQADRTLYLRTDTKYAWFLMLLILGVSLSMDLCGYWITGHEDIWKYERMTLCRLIKSCFLAVNQLQLGSWLLYLGTISLVEFLIFYGSD